MNAKHVMPRFRINEPKGKKEPNCIALFDRMVIGCEVVYMPALLKLSGFKCVRSHLLRRKTPNSFLPYGRVTVLKSTMDNAQIFIYSQAGSSKLDPYRITFIPDDKTGLQPVHVCSVLALVESYRIVLLEVPFDFSRSSQVDAAFVRVHGVFGKCRPYSVGRRQGWDAWGSRAGAKFVRSYWKNGRHRVELQLQLRFLKEHGIRNLSDLVRLATILPQHHILFADLNTPRLNRLLESTRFGSPRARRILEGSHSESHLVAHLRHLRLGLRNVHRLLLPLPINAAVAGALRELAAKWHTASMDEQP